MNIDPNETFKNKLLERAFFATGVGDKTLRFLEDTSGGRPEEAAYKWYCMAVSHTANCFEQIETVGELLRDCFEQELPVGEAARELRSSLRFMAT